MRIIKGRYLPDYVLVEDQFIPFDSLEKEMKYEVFSHGKSEYSVNERPLMKRLIHESSIIVMKYNGSFNGEEFLKMKNFANKNGFILQWLIKEARGGGRGVHSWGHVYFATKNLIEKYMKELNIWENLNKLPKAKQVVRIQKFLGPGEKMPIKPRIKLGGEFKHEGLIFVNQNYMTKCNIVFGAKSTGPTKGLMIPTSVEDDSWDILLPENENKLKLNEEQLSNTFMINRNLNPEQQFSRNLVNKTNGVIGRNPRYAFDVATNIGFMPKKERLSFVKNIYEGKEDIEKVADMLFSYTDKEGKKGYNTFGKKLIAGESLYSPGIWPEANKALLTLAKARLQPNISGVYGVAMPLSLLKHYRGVSEHKRGWLTRFPWTLPIRSSVEIWKHCMFVDEGLWRAYGGDYDGDLSCIYDIDEMKGHLRWDHDMEWIKSKMILPEKKDQKKDNRSMEEVIASQLDQYAFCGQIYNSGKIAIESTRMNCKHSHMDLLEMELLIQSKEVQPRIDGFKYEQTNEEAKDSSTLAKEYKGDASKVEHVKPYFNVFRSSRVGIDELVHLGGSAENNSRSHYEKMASWFKGWKRGDAKKTLKEISNENI